MEVTLVQQPCAPFERIEETVKTTEWEKTYDWNSQTCNVISEIMPDFTVANRGAAQSVVWCEVLWDRQVVERKENDHEAICDVGKLTQ